MKKQVSFIAALLTFVFTYTFGQVPQAFKYQTIARNSSGNISANTKVSFRMSILQGSTSATVSYEETDTATTNQFGLANLSIGTGAVVSGSMTAINWSNGPYYLKIEFDPNGGSNYTLMGISEMLSVPYALYSQTTGDTSMWKKSGTSIYYAHAAIAGSNGTYNGYLSENFNVMGHTLIADTVSTGTGVSNILRIYKHINGVVGTPSPAIEFEGGNYPGHLGRGNISAQPNVATNGIAKDLVFGVPPGNVSPGQETERMKLDGNTGNLAMTTAGQGIVMKSSNGTCYLLTVSNTGTLVITATTCP